MRDIERLADLIEPEAEALGFELVRVKMVPSEAGDGGEALQIMAEDPATGQLVIEQCAELSRRVSAMMDAHEEAGDVLIEGAYHLEVSSPGIDRPLTRTKDFANWAGHETKLAMAKGYDGPRVYKGILEGLKVEDDAETVQIKDKNGVTHFVPREDIHSAKLILTDALIAATKPLDTSGVDEVIDGNDDIEEEKADN